LSDRPTFFRRQIAIAVYGLNPYQLYGTALADCSYPVNSLDTLIAFMRTMLHLGIAGYDNLSAVIREALQPWHVVFGVEVCVSGPGRVVRRALDFKVAGNLPKLAFLGESLQDFYQSNRNILIKCDFQAALAK
jgi:hypothetical protein